MATVNNWLTSVGGSGVTGNYNQAPSMVDSPIIKKRFLDCSTNNMTSGEYHKIFAIPANCSVSAKAAVHTAEGGTGTIDLVVVLDSDTAATGTTLVLANDYDVNTTVTNPLANTITASGSVTAASSLCVLANNTLDTAKFWVIMEIVPLATTD